MLLELRGCSSWGASAAAFRLISSSSSRCLLLLPFLVMGEQGLYPRCTFMPLFCLYRDGRFNPVGDGNGTRVYVVDTGIRTTHVEFGGRAVRGVDLITPSLDSEDCRGHGTHVAGW